MRAETDASLPKRLTAVKNKFIEKGLKEELTYPMPQPHSLTKEVTITITVLLLYTIHTARLSQKFVVHCFRLLAILCAALHNFIDRLYWRKNASQLCSRTFETT